MEKTTESSVVASYNARRFAMNNFIRLRRAGVSFDALVQDQMNRNVQELAIRIAELARILKERQQIIEKDIDALISAVEAIDFSAPGRLQTENLESQIHALEKAQGGISTELTKAEDSLRTQRELKAQLINALQKLRYLLSQRKNPLDFQYKLGEKVSAYVSKSRN
jgi:hypothetical protein